MRNSLIATDRQVPFHADSNDAFVLFGPDFGSGDPTCRVLYEQQIESVS